VGEFYTRVSQADISDGGGIKVITLILCYLLFYLMNFNISNPLKAFFIALIGWLIVAANLKLLPSAFPGFWLEFPPFHPGEDDEKIYLFLFLLSKVLGVLLLALYALLAVDWIGEKKIKATRWLDGYFKKFITVVEKNWIIAAQYNKGIRLVFILWGLLMLTCLLTIPYHYDEAWSYHYFSRHGWLRTMTFYPLPNNHIFFNLVVVLFSWLPLDPVITTRLPSLPAVFIGSFYFLKLCRFYFSENLSLFLTFLLSSMYPFIIYGIEGRGYGFLICFSILQLYAANHLAIEYRSRKYRILYYFSFAAGLYTITSHLYFILPIHALLFVYVLRNKGWLVFIFDSFKAALVVFILYWIIVYCNGFKVLSSPNGSVYLSSDKLIPAIWEHLRNTWRWLTSSKLPLFTVLLLLLAPLADMVLKKRNNSWLNVAVFVLLIFPPVILYFQRLVFYVRLWTYLIVPIVIGLGFLLSLLAPAVTRIPVYHRFKDIYPAALAVLLVLNFSLFIKKHKEEYVIDYAIEALFRKIQPELRSAKTVYFTRQSMEYYVAEQLVYKAARINPDRPVEMSAEGTVSGQDVLILSPSVGLKELPQLVNYQLAGSYSDVFSLYTRK
jgi:hypothetical protein